MIGRTIPLVLLAVSLCACGPRPSAEEEIRTLVAQAEQAAEERDARALGELVADDYSDARGHTARDLRRLLHGYLVMHQAVHLVVRIEEIELLGNELARVRATVGMLGRGADPDAGWDVATDLRDLEVRLARDGTDWRVIRAQW